MPIEKNYQITNPQLLQRQLDDNPFIQKGYSIKYTEEHNKIFDAILNDKACRNIFINAVAGSGKSTTIRNCIGLIPQDKVILVLAHNRSVKDEMRAKFIPSGRIMTVTDDSGIIRNKINPETGTEYTPLSIQTFHGLGYLTIANINNWRDQPVTIGDNDKYLDYFNEHINEFTPFGYASWDEPKKRNYRQNIKSILDFARVNLCQSVKDIEKKVVAHYGISPVANESEVVQFLMEWGIANIKQPIMDFTDCIWLPNVSDDCNTILYKRRHKYDYIFVDEAQDMSPAQINLLIKASRTRNTRVILMGDREQAINMWCGSKENAIDYAVKKITNNDWIELHLSKNYRCATKILDYANEYLSTHNMSNRLVPNTTEEGSIVYNAKLSDIKNGDLVLARFSSTIFDVFTRLAQRGMKVKIRGEQDFLKQFDSLTDGTVSINDMVKKAKASFVNEWISSTKDDDYKASMRNNNVIRRYEVVKSMESLSTILHDLQALRMLLKSCIVPDDLPEGKERDYVELSTVHRAKGAEADNVYIVCPSVLYSPLVTDKSMSWEKVSENNLQYVAFTRAKKMMAFVDEKEIRMSLTDLDNGESLYKEMLAIKDEIEMK